MFGNFYILFIKYTSSLFRIRLRSFFGLQESYIGINIIMLWCERAHGCRF